MIKLPDIRLKSIIDAIIGLIETDWTNAAGDKSTSFLYRLLYGNNFGYGNNIYNFYEESVKIFIRAEDDPRKLETRLLFDTERAALPTIHLSIPSEESAGDGIGMDAGYIDNTDLQDGTAIEYLVRSYSSNYELVVTGSNTFEVLLIFNVLKAALIVNTDTLEYNGFRNPKIFGGDLKINSQHTPVMFMRILNLKTFFDFVVPKMDSVSLFTSINFTGKAYEN